MEAFGRTRLVSLLLGFCLVTPVTFGQTVRIYFDHDFDFSGIKRYEWRTHPVFEKQPELKEVYATGIQLVLQAGNEQFKKQGLEPADSSPDVFVTFFLLANDGQKTTTTIDPGPWFGGYGWYAPPVWTTTTTEYFKNGMLVVDIVDASTSKLVWRAICGDQIKDMSKRDKNINSAVRKALGRFPPKRK